MFTPLREGLGQLNYSKIRRKVLECFAKNNYELLEKELKTFSNNQLEAIFLKEGRTFLERAINQSNVLALSFMRSKIPSKIIVPILNEGNFSLLKQFLSGQAMMEKCNFSSEKERNLRVEKLKIISEIDQDGIVEFVKSSEVNNEDYLTSEIKEDLYSCLISTKSKKY